MKKDRDTPQSMAGSDVSHNSAPIGIPNELLDSVLETAKLPVWKPPDKGDQAPASLSPAKLPIQSPSKPAPVTTDRDSSFDDLVRHIDSSPSQKDQQLSSTHPSQIRQFHKVNNHHDPASASEAERSDYDNDQLSMGGVDYDDLEEDYPKKLPQKKAPSYKDQPSSDVGKDSAQGREATTRRGTKAPCYAEKAEEEFDKPKAGPVLTKQVPAKNQKKPTGRVFGNRKNLKIDQKALGKVEKNLKGTDFDFGDEFDDDFGASPKPDIKSLKGFRDQSKKAPIYMKETEQIPPVPDFDEDFEDKVPYRPAPRGRGRRPLEAEKVSNEIPEPEEEEPKKVPKVKISLKKQLKNRAEEDAPVEEILEKVEKPKPKIPTLTIKIGGRTESPASNEGEDVDKGKKRSEERVGSIESEEPVNHQRIPKLKIKFGAPKADSPKDELDFKDDLEDPPPLVIRSGTTPTSSPGRQRRTPQHNSKPGTPAGERLSTSELALVKASPRNAGSATSSPASRRAKDSKADRTEDNADLQKIFGGDEPLPVGLMSEAQRQAVGKSDEGPSELELLAMELSNQLAKEKQMKQQKEEAAKMENDDEIDHPMHHDPKYKFKQMKQREERNTNSPTPTTPIKLNLAQASAAAAAPKSSFNPMRMRKKELLNQYYGIEPEVPVSAASVPLPASNGPAPAMLEAAPAPQPPSNPGPRPSLTREPVRQIIKMPKAVASVTSVPTRADYQQQLEDIHQRKRKRDGMPEDYKKGKGGKGKNKKEKANEEPYKPKIKMPSDGAEEEASKEMRKTRGKPPKKCLADSPEREDDPVGSFIENQKNEALKYAEEIHASFEADKDKSERRKGKKKRRRDNEDEPQPNTKTPRIVIKFSKNKDPPPSRNIPSDNNGLIKPPAQKESEGPKLPKLKIKNLIEPSTT